MTIKIKTRFAKGVDDIPTMCGTSIRLLLKKWKINWDYYFFPFDCNVNYVLHTQMNYWFEEIENYTSHRQYWAFLTHLTLITSQYRYMYPPYFKYFDNITAITKTRDFGQLVTQLKQYFERCEDLFILYLYVRCLKEHVLSEPPPRQGTIIFNSSSGMTAASTATATTFATF